MCKHKTTILLKPRPYRAAIALIITYLLSGCALTTLPRKQVFFTLQPSADANITVVSGKPQASIRYVSIPSYLNQAGIARQIAPNQIAVSADARWATPLSESIPTLLANYLQALVKSPIETNPLPPGIQVDTLIEVRITRFIADDKSLYLQAQYRLIKPKQLRSHCFNTQLPLADTQTKTLVSTYSQAIEGLASDIAKHL